MRAWTPVALLIAGWTGSAAAQIGFPKDPASNRVGDAGLMKSGVASTPGGFGPRVAATDRCADAPAAGDGDLIEFDLSNATNDYPGSCGASAVAPDQWVKVSVAADSLVEVSTCGLASGDTVLLATDGCGGPELACNDDDCSVSSRILFTLAAGRTAFVRIAGYNGSLHAGQALVSVTSGSGRVTASDGCAAAPLARPGLHAFSLADATNDYPGPCGDTATAPDVWLRYTTGASAQRVTASTCGLTQGDSVLAFVDGCGGSTIACLDDSCGLQARLGTILPAQTTVLVRIADHGGGRSSGQIEISAVDVVRPANDRCQDAAPLAVGSTAEFDSSFADDDGAASCGFSGDPGGHSVWYRFTPEADGGVEISTCDGTLFDTTISLFGACGGPELACNDDVCGLASTLNATVRAGQEYRVRIAGYGASAGPGTVRLSAAEPCVITRPGGSILENEDCQRDILTDHNGGCNDPEGEVQSVAYNTAVFGTCSTYINPGDGVPYRDTDCYEVDFAGGTFVASGRAAYNLRLFILDTSCPPIVLASDASTRPCQDVTVFAQVAPGPCRVLATVDGFTGLGCGGAVDNHYVLNVGLPGGGCTADFNDDGFVDFFDYSDYVGCFETGVCPPGRTADVNGDEFVDFFDYADFVDAFGVGC